MPKIPQDNQERALDIVRQVGEIHFEGNIIPHSWYHHIVYPDKHRKPHLVAIVLLSELVYWYRPTPDLDERTGRVIGFHKKFAGTMLQRSQIALAEKFGLSRQQVRDGLARLKELQLIRTETRDSVSSDGVPLSNVFYIEVDPVQLRSISTLASGDTSHGSTGMGDRSVEPTYTKTSTKKADGLTPEERAHLEHTLRMFGGDE